MVGLLQCCLLARREVTPSGGLVSDTPDLRAYNSRALPILPGSYLIGIGIPPSPMDCQWDIYAIWDVQMGGQWEQEVIGSQRTGGG